MVTPSLDQGGFLSEAVESVLAQGVERLDYLVVDGGSSDGSQEVLGRFGSRLRWLSEADGGQSQAINKGFERTEGEILGWLNADDRLAPGALARVGEIFARHPEVDLVYGRGDLLDASGQVVGPFVGIEPFSLWRLIHFLDFVLQPAAFFRRRAFEAVGGLDESLTYTMDWDLWIRLAARGRVHYLEEVLGCSREHAATKTSTGGWRRMREISRLVRRHSGRGWTPGVQMYFLDTVRRVVGGRVPRGLGRVVDAVVGRAMQRIVSTVGVYADGWHGPRSAITWPTTWPGLELELDVPVLEGRDRMEIRIEAPGAEGWVEAVTAGRHRLRWRPEATQGDPLSTARMTADAAIRPAADRRELAFRLLRLEPWIPEGGSP